MSLSAASYEAYKRVDIETASQGKLIVMLLNAALRKAEESKQEMSKEEPNITNIHKSLIRAQDIISELRAALDMSAGEVATNLDRLYEYFQHLLIEANIRKSTTPIDQFVDFVTQVRDTWEELFQKLSKEEVVVPAPPVNPHGARVMNLEG